MENNLISIIVPVYDLERYIQRCIDSILAQTYGNIELVLVDDGSKDQSGHICDKNKEKDSRIKVIHQDNSGVSVARNNGLKEATGEYIMFVDGDDRIHPQMCEILLWAAEKHQADIAMCDFRSVPDSEVTYEKIKETPQVIVMDRSRTVLMVTDMKNGTHVNTFAKLYRKEILEGITYLPGIPLGEDQEFVFSCLVKSNSIVFVKDVLYDYIFREGSAVNSKLNIEKEKKRLVAFNRICEKSYMINPVIRNRIIVFRACQCELATINRMIDGNQIDKSILENSRKYIRKYIREIFASDFPMARKLQLLLAEKSFGLYRRLYQLMKLERSNGGKTC